MKALVFDESLRLDGDRPMPDRPGEALIRVTTAGICNTDLELVKGYMGFRGTLGHEFVGVVENAPDSTLIGKRVVGEINCGRCGTCEPCLRGHPTHCANRTVLGILKRDGAFAEYVSLPVENLHVVPDDLPDKAAVFTEPLAAALQIREQVRVRPDDRAIIIGDGKLGLLIAQVLHQCGTRTTLIGRHPAKLALAERWGIRTIYADPATHGHGEPGERGDIVVDVTGSAAGFQTALAHTVPRGTLVLKSTVAGDTALPLAPVVIDEITIIGSRCGPFAPALRMLHAGAIDTKSLIHAEYPLSDGLRAFEHAATRGTLKVLLRMDT